MNREQARRLLTDTEWELMSIVWDLGEATVSDVMAKLPASRQLAYTSVSTMLRILEKKEVLASRKHGRRHIYTPTLERPECERASVLDMVDRVFGGASVHLVKTLVETKGLTKEELDEIRSLLPRD